MGGAEAGLRAAHEPESFPGMADGDEELEVEVDDGGDEAQPGAATGAPAARGLRTRGPTGAWPPVAAGAPALAQRSRAGVRARGARRAGARWARRVSPASGRWPSRRCGTRRRSPARRRRARGLVRPPGTLSSLLTDTPVCPIDPCWQVAKERKSLPRGRLLSMLPRSRQRFHRRRRRVPADSTPDAARLVVCLLFRWRGAWPLLRRALRLRACPAVCRPRTS